MAAAYVERYAVDGHDIVEPLCQRLRLTPKPLEVGARRQDLQRDRAVERAVVPRQTSDIGPWPRKSSSRYRPRTSSPCLMTTSALLRAL